MKKNVVYMINIVHDERSKSQKYEWSIKSWTDWCKKNDVDLYILTEPLTDIKYMKPQWYKIFIFNLLENSKVDYDQIMYVDSDTIVHPDMPNIFELTEQKFCAVRNYGSMDWVNRSIENYSKYVFDGFQFPYYKYFNSGLFIFNKIHKDLFSKIQTFYQSNYELIHKMQTIFGVGNDQPILNFFVHHENIDLKFLPYQYNMQDMQRFEVIGDDFLHTEYGWIYHFNCGIKPSPGYWMEKTYKYLKQN